MNESSRINAKETHFSLGNMQAANVDVSPSLLHNKRPPRPSEGPKSPRQATPNRNNIPRIKPSNGATSEHSGGTFFYSF
jgi:hypothetical protein